MLKALRLNLLMGTVAAVTVGGSAVVHHQQQIANQTRIDKMAAQLESYKEHPCGDDAALKQQLANEKFARDVEALKKKSHAYAGNESKTWTKTY